MTTVKARRRAADVEVGEELPPLAVRVRRSDLIQYAGASLDLNPIHWNERVATSVGLPNVIAHGMYTMALGGRLVTDWTGDPAALIEYGARFTRPVVVADDDAGTLVEFAGKVVDKQDDGRVRIEISATCDGKTVLARTSAVCLLRL